MPKPDPEKAGDATAVVTGGVGLTGASGFGAMGGGSMGMGSTGPLVGSSQATRHGRRLYVGNLPHEGATEDELFRFFNEVVTKALVEPLPGGMVPCLSVFVAREGRFGFVEFATVELCTACMALDGIFYKGTNLRIKRPKDYRPETLPPSTNPVPALRVGPELGVMSMGGGPVGVGGPGGGVRIYVGGIPYTLMENDLVKLFEPFGAVRSLEILRDNTGTSRGYGFVEFVDSAVADSAIAALNGLAVAGRNLTVKRANPRPDGAGGAPAMAPAFGMNMGMGAGAGPPAYGATGVPPPAPIANAGTPSVVLVLSNMVTDEDLRDERSVADLKEDIVSEASKAGRVLGVHIPRGSERNAELRNIYVRYEDEASAGRAQQMLDGRKFGGSTVVARFGDPSDFPM